MVANALPLRQQVEFHHQLLKRIANPLVVRPTVRPLLFDFLPNHWKHVPEYY